MCSCRSRSTKSIPMGCRRALPCARRCRVRAARRARNEWRRLGRKRYAQSAFRQPSQGYPGQARRSTVASGTSQIRRLGCRLHAQLARHGAAHVPAPRRASRPRARKDRCAACRRSPQAHDCGARPCAEIARRRHGAREKRSRAGRGRFCRRDRWPDRRWRIGNSGIAARTGCCRAQSRSPAAGFHRRAARSRQCATRHHYKRRLFGHADRWRDRLGKTEVYFEAVAETCGAAGRS